MFVFQHFLVEITVFLEAVFVDGSYWKGKISEGLLVVKIQLLITVISNHPWKNRVLTKIIKTPIAQGVHKHDVFKGRDLSENPHLQNDLLFDYLETHTVFLKEFVDCFSDFEIFKVEE